MQVPTIILELIINDVIENDIFMIGCVIQISSLFYNIVKPIVTDKESLLFKKYEIIVCKSVCERVCKAARLGQKDLIDFYLKKDAAHQTIVRWKRNIWNDLLHEASVGGHKSLIDYFVERGANNWNLGLAGATVGNNEYLIKFFIEKGANNWNLGLCAASVRNNKNLINYFIEKGANNWHCAINHAIYHDHKNLIEFFWKKIWNETLN